jgi:hypothetical protein
MDCPGRSAGGWTTLRSVMALPRLVDIAMAYCRHGSESGERSMQTRIRRIA